MGAIDTGALAASLPPEVLMKAQRDPQVCVGCDHVLLRAALQCFAVVLVLLLYC